MHVFDPVRYATAANARYTPKTHTASDAIKFEATVGMHGIVLVQPSSYGTDNSCMLDALLQLGPEKARAVVMLDPERTDLETLEKWHTWGVRGVRVNLQSVEWTPSAGELASMLRKYADVIRPMNWVLQIYATLATIESIEDIVPSLGVRICIDHIGHPILNSPDSIYSQTWNPHDLPGFSSLTRLLQGGKTFVKMSGAYRFSQSKDYEDVAPIAQEILKVAGHDRVVFATDWPHTRFDGLDIKPWVEKVLEWCTGDAKLIDRVFRDNAIDLWDCS